MYSDAAWKEILKNKPTQTTAFNEYKEFCKDYFGKDMKLQEMKLDWGMLSDAQKQEFQNKADAKKNHHQNEIQNWLNLYGVTQEQVNAKQKEMNFKEKKEQKEKKEKIQKQEERDVKFKQSKEEKPKEQKQAQKRMKQADEENREPNGRSHSQESEDGTNQIHQDPIMAKKKRVVLAREKPCRRQRIQNKPNHEQVKEQSPRENDQQNSGEISD